MLGESRWKHAEFLGEALDFLLKMSERGLHNVYDLLHKESIDPKNAAWKVVYFLDDYLDGLQDLDNDKLSACLMAAARGDHSHDTIWRNEILPRLHVAGLRLTPLCTSREDAQNVMSYLAESYMQEPDVIPEEIEKEMREHAVRLSKKTVDNETDAIYMARMCWLEQGTPFARQYLALAYEGFQNIYPECSHDGVVKVMMTKAFPGTDIEGTSFGAFVDQECEQLALQAETIGLR